MGQENKVVNIPSYVKHNYPFFILNYWLKSLDNASTEPIKVPN